MNKMYRLFYFLLLVCLPIIFGWWLFVVLAILLVYLAKLPYEIVLAGVILDAVYYFGDGILARYALTTFALLIILAALFLNNKVHWRQVF